VARLVELRGQRKGGQQDAGENQARTMNVHGVIDL
jgi:hypothetical protein